MKTIATLFVLCWVVSGFASIPTIPKNKFKTMTCSQSQAIVREAGSIEMTFKILGLPAFYEVHSTLAPLDCEDRSSGRQTFSRSWVHVKSSDKSDCFIGLTCIESTTDN